MIQTKTSGFTLIEILITMAILAILLNLGIASLQDFLLRHKNQDISLQLVSTFAYARSEAIKRNKIVAICGSADFQHCQNDWSKGYMVFVADNPDDIQPQHVLRVEQIHHSHPIHSNQQTVIKYSGDGKCLTRSTISIANHQKIVIYDSGRARIETVAS